MKECLAYLIEDPRDKSLALCILDQEHQQSHVFPIAIQTAARLAYECSDRVNVHLGAIDFKRAGEEIALVMSQMSEKSKEQDILIALSSERGKVG